MDQAEKAARGLVVAGGDGSKALQVVEESFDEVALGEERAPLRQLSASFRLRRDHRKHLVLTDVGAEVVRVVARVADECPATRVGEQLSSRNQLMALPLRERDVERAALGVDDRVDLRGEATT